MRNLTSLLAALLAITTVPASSDEGMWTFDAFPRDLLRRTHGVEITPQWLDRVRNSTVRLAGCTASFVSANGLILTNQHCAEGCLAQNSTRNKSLLKDGFFASSREKEVRCGTQVADVLVAVEDVTAQVNSATQSMDTSAANEARKKALTQIEQACEQATRAESQGGPLTCEAVDLYNGGQYFLYKYKRYTDVRLVFAPESAIASFGGDPDNFQFPRWWLDVAFMRAYGPDGKPASTPRYLKIDFAGPTVNELVFVSGHPAATNRLLTVSQLQTKRDIDLPQWLLRSSELRGRYIQFSKSGPEAERIVQGPLTNLENGIKFYRKELDALHDEAALQRKSAEEARLRTLVAADPKLASEVGDPWAEIEKTQQVLRTIAVPFGYLEAGAGFNSQLFRYARFIVRGVAERSKPNLQRLREFRDTALAHLEQQLGAAVPVYPELEQITLSLSLDRMREWLGPDHPVVRQILGKDSPDALAKRLIEGSKLADAALRIRLWNGNAQALEDSGDPMLQLVTLIEPESRALRKRYEDQVEAPLQKASKNLARARFAVLGTSVYPDATFTLRLNFGTVQGWVENGAAVQPFTTLQRAFERATGQEPFQIPDSWLKAKARLNPQTQFNLSTNNDILSGNSGSPLIDAKGNIVGIMFDGNIHSISGDFWFDEEKNRAIAVDPTIILEALKKVYAAGPLLKELGSS
jgi:hypothetical protein